MNSLKKTRGIVARSVAVAAAAAGAAAANAAGTGVDVTATVSTITDQLAPIGLVGAAVLGVVVAVKAFKWVRAALS